MSQRVLVTDGGERSALAVVRSLGRAGHVVEVAAPVLPCLAGRSKWAAASHQLSDPFDAIGRYRKAVRNLVERRDIDLVIPVTDGSMTVLLDDEGDGSEVPVPFGPWPAYRQLSDKFAVLERAREVGLTVPRTRVLRSVDELDDLRRNVGPFPLIAKPHRSISRSNGRLCRSGVVRVGDVAELVERLTALSPGAFPVLLQQPVEGSGTGVFLMTWEGRRVAYFAHRRIREKPPSGGVSVYREAIEPHPELLERATRLVLGTGWNGVAMVELKGEAGSPAAAVMEVNARFWGSLQLAADAGVDFPRLLLDATRGDPPPDDRAYRTGIRSRWFWGDVDQLVTRVRHPVGRSDGRWEAQSSLLAVLSDLISYHPGRDRFEICRLSDFRPFLHETRRWFAALGTPESNASGGNCIGVTD